MNALNPSSGSPKFSSYDDVVARCAQGFSHWSALAAEELTTVKLMAEAQRRKALTLIQAEEKSEADAIQLRSLAKAQRDSAEDKANAERIASEAERDHRLAMSAAKHADIAADNAKSESVIGMEMEAMKLKALPEIIAQMVKPAEKINGININQISGFGHSGGASEASTPVNAAMDSIMEMAVQLPALKKIGEQIGVSIDTNLGAINKD